jgi:hypothetical protein
MGDFLKNDSKISKLIKEDISANKRSREVHLRLRCKVHDKLVSQLKEALAAHKWCFFTEFEFSHVCATRESGSYEISFNRMVEKVEDKTIPTSMKTSKPKLHPKEFLNKNPPKFIKNYDDLIFYCDKYDLYHLKVEKCVVKLRDNSICFCSTEGGEAVFSLIKSLKLRVDFSETAMYIERLERDLALKKAFFEEVSSSILFDI